MKTWFEPIVMIYFATVVLCIGDARGQHRTAVPDAQSARHSNIDAAVEGVRLLGGKTLRPGFEHSQVTPARPRRSEMTEMLGIVRLVPQQYPTIQAGINASVHGDTVLVSEGTYLENIKYRGKRVIVASLYLLDQDTGHISRTIIDGSQPAFSDSGSTVSFVSGEDTNSVLCGFTVRGGYGTFIPEWDEADGGGVFLWESGGRLVRNIITENHVNAPNAWGGGVSIDGFTNLGQTLIMEQNIVRRNSVTGQATLTYGGGVGVYESQFRFIGNVFDENSCRGFLETGGGGVVVNATTDNQQPGVIRGNVFKNNVVVGDSISISGGLVMLYTGATLIDNNSFDDNTVTSLNTFAYGGGMAVWELDAATPEKQITGNIFRRNRVSSPNGYARGGALVNVRTKVKLGRNQLQDNSIDAGITSVGGGIYANAWGGLIENNIVVRNRGQYGGGIGHFGVPPSGVTQAIVNNTVSKNLGEFGGGLYGGDNTVSILLNNIFWDDTSSNGEIYTTGSIEAHYSNIEGGWIGGTGNINANPMFVDSLCRISGQSPCVAAGTDSMQISGVWYRAPSNDFFENPRPRPVATRPDIGAHEFQTTTGVKNTSDVPASFSLSQNYPNPFNPSTTFSFSVLHTSLTILKVYDVLGREITTLVNEEKQSGTHRVEWNAEGLASGVYFYRLQAGGFIETKKMLLMR